MNSLPVKEELESPPVAAEPLASPPHRRLVPLSGATIAILAVCSALACPALTLAWFWFSSSGVGEYRNSSDDRYEASVTKWRRGTWTGRIDRYVEIEVTELKSGRQIWYVVQRYSPDVEPPAYESRNRRFVEWASDSKSVAIPVAGGRTLTFDVP